MSHHQQIDRLPSSQYLVKIEIYYCYFIIMFYSVIAKSYGLAVNFAKEQVQRNKTKLQR